MQAICFVASKASSRINLQILQIVQEILVPVIEAIRPAAQTIHSASAEIPATTEYFPLEQGYSFSAVVPSLQKYPVRVPKCIRNRYG